MGFFSEKNAFLVSTVLRSEVQIYSSQLFIIPFCWNGNHILPHLATPGFGWKRWKRWIWGSMVKILFATRSTVLAVSGYFVYGIPYKTSCNPRYVPGLPLVVMTIHHLILRAYISCWYILSSKHHRHLDIIQHAQQDYIRAPYMFYLRSLRAKPDGLVPYGTPGLVGNDATTQNCMVHYQPNKIMRI